MSKALTGLLLKSYAKINLCLYVTGRAIQADGQPGGYHNLVSVVQAIDWSDELTFELSPDKLRVGTDHPALVDSEQNIVYQALQLLKIRYNVPFGMDVQIKKGIPLQAGLGGGSSNAACALKAANRLWNLNLSISDLSQLGGQIGSDVPFFFSSGQAVLKGRGELVEPITMFSDYWVVLAVPSFGISTAWAYQQLTNLTIRLPLEYFYQLERKDRFKTALSVFENDLERPVIKVYPLLDQVKKGLLNSGAAKVSMTGSGAAIYGIFFEQPILGFVRQSMPAECTVRCVRPVELPDCTPAD